jgi:hypothetical protein
MTVIHESLVYFKSFHSCTSIILHVYDKVFHFVLKAYSKLKEGFQYFFDVFGTTFAYIKIYTNIHKKMKGDL